MTASRAFLDRIEGDMAVLIVGESELAVPRNMLPPDAREGCALIVNIECDWEETTKSVDRIKGLIDRLSGDG